MFGFGKKVTLAVLENTVKRIKNSGVAPDRATMVTMVALASALRIPVTAAEEGKEEISYHNGEASRDLSMVPVIEAETEEEVEALEAKITALKEGSEEQIGLLHVSADRHSARAKEVEELLKLL